MYIKHAYKEPKANFFLIVMEGERTDEIVSKSKILYQNVWVVFDKDDFEDFDDAIFEINELGEGKYQKNYEDIYELINQVGSTETAVRNAKRRMADYEKMNYSLLT